MRSGAIALLLGMLAFQQLPELPDARWALLLPALIPLAVYLPPLRLPAIAAGGFLWALIYAHYLAFPVFDVSLERRDLVLEGWIASIPERREHGLRFELDVSKLTLDGKEYPAPGRVRLGWYRSFPPLRAGEQWRFKARLKRPRGLMNPGGFDYEGWLFRRHLSATGYVKPAPGNRRLDAGPGGYRLERARQALGEAIAGARARSDHAGILVALAIGDAQGISPAQWDVFTRTGTNHLVAISGLHIGLVAGLVFFLVRGSWARSAALVLRLAAPKAAAVAGLLAAAGYSALAGFSIPTQRSLIMIAAAMLGLVLQRQTPPGRTLALALLLVLSWDPMSVLAAGFWLSFGAVAVILYGMSGRLAPRGLWWRWGRVQWLVAVGLLPPLLVLFQRAPLLSPLANLVAVPWVSLVVTPLTLVGTVLLVWAPWAGGALLNLADLCLGALWPFLAWIARLPYSQWMQPAPAAWALIAAIPGIVLLLAPQGFPARWLGGVLLLPMFLLRPPAPAPGAVWLTLLDVGQGLAAVVRTRHHALVYDTGPRSSARFDAGSAVVVPYLRHMGIPALDLLLVSHGDNDHIGGARSILQRMPVRSVLTSVPRKLGYASARRCVAGQSWRWDGVEFHVVHPPPEWFGRGNDASCVLRVRAPGGSLLLTGDIERPAEEYLLRHHARALPARILVVPHHGSRTSSSAAFINR
ncbi:MAG: DNA internalization-related competence protein ComEC/Rec2, partial [Gammaproteobacteria bacterium]|nr:DNA internalization-related competence protein ComEC/Rec2 [Gammaproteobacteria bacterium]